MSLYADTSLLVSYYVNDTNSDPAQELIQAATAPTVFTSLHRLELRNALALGVFRKILSPVQVRAALTDLERDMRGGRVVPVPINWIPIFRLAAHWATHHTPTLGTRSL